MKNEQEVWVSIPNYPKYQISNYGRVISYQRKNPKILKSHIDTYGYPTLILYKNKKVKKYTVHQLVILSFKGIEPNGMRHTIDHIDGNKLNNHIDNLEVVSMRENTNRYYSNKKTSSKYTGVSWSKFNNKYISYVTIDGKLYHLGYNEDEEVCYKWYLKTLDYLYSHSEQETIQYIKSKEYKNI